MTWGQFRNQDPEAWPQDRVLREAKTAGFNAVCSFPGQGSPPEQHLEYLADFGLAPAPSYYSGEFWDLEKREEFLRGARRLAKTSQRLGLTELFVAVDGWDYLSRANGKTRSQLAGHVGPEDGLTLAEWEACAATLNALGAATREEGVLACFHNHVGTVVETRQECDTLARLTDPQFVAWGLDTGHLAFAGADVTDFVRTYAPRIKALHLKDVNETVRLQAVEGGWDYGQATAAGIWTELGQGSISFAEMFQMLREAEYQGWVISEIDVTQRSSALESATLCREFLRSLGL